MNEKSKSILVKLILVIFEFAFIAILFFLHVLDIGWIFILFGILLVLWAIIHLGLMTSFIVSSKFSLSNISLYLVVHFFYMVAWLFQSHVGDRGEITWVIQKIFDSVSFPAFLKKWGAIIYF